VATDHERQIDTAPDHVGDDQQRRAEPAGDQVAADLSQSSCDSHIPSTTASSTGSPCSGEAPGDQE
jgi:hypothetical protein